MEEYNSCKFVRLSLWDYAAQRLAPSQSDAVSTHLDGCRECDRYLADVTSFRTGFRHMTAPAMPKLVATRIQVMASRERSRQLLRRDPATWLRDKVTGLRVSFDNLLRPFAVPAAGGILASCLCFAMIVHTLQLRYLNLTASEEMPVSLNTEVMINDLSPFSFSKKNVTVELSVDAHGQVTAVSPMVQGSNFTQEEMNQIASQVLYSTYTPATRYGQPVASKRLLAITHYDVRD